MSAHDILFWSPVKKLYINLMDTSETWTRYLKTKMEIKFGIILIEFIF